VEDRVVIGVDFQLRRAREAQKALKDFYATGTQQAKIYSKSARKASQEVEQAFKALGIKSTAEVKREIQKLTRAYETLRRSGKATATDLARAQAALNRQTKELNAQLKVSAGSFQRIKQHWISILATLYALNRAFAEYLAFSRKMTEVNTLLAVTDERYRQLVVDVIELSTRVPQSATELAKGLYDLISAGAPLAKSIRMLELAAKAAVAGVTDTQTAIRTGMAVLNAYSMSLDKLGAVYDTLFQTVKLGVTTFPELAQSIGLVLPVARIAGTGINEVAAAIATLTKAGLSTPIAVTALANGLRSLSTPTAEAKEEMRKLGITWRGLTKTLQDIKALKLTAEQLREIIPDVRAGRALITLVQNLEVFTSILNRMTESAGATQEAYSKRTKDLGVQLKLLVNQVNALVLSIQEGLAPALIFIVKVLKELVKIVQAIPGPLKSLLAVLVSTKIALVAWGAASSLAAKAAEAYAAGATAAAGATLALNTAMKASLVLLLGFMVIQGVAKIFEAMSTNHAKLAKQAKLLAKSLGDEVVQLEDLRNRLVETQEGTEAHTKAELELAQVLPNANAVLDDRGRLLAIVNRESRENLDLLDRRIKALKAEKEFELAVALENQAKALEQARSKLERFRKALVETQGEQGSWLTSSKEFAKQLRAGFLQWSKTAKDAYSELATLASVLASLNKEERDRILALTHLNAEQKSYVRSLISRQGAVREQAKLEQELQNLEQEHQRLLQQRRDMEQELTEQQIRDTRTLIRGYRTRTRHLEAELNKATRAFQRYQKEVQTHEEAIYNIKKTTEEKVREIRRRGLSEEQKATLAHQDYRRLMTQAEQQLLAEEYKRAIEAAKNAQAIAMGFKDQEEAIRGVRRAGDIMVQAHQSMAEAATTNMETQKKKIQDLRQQLQPLGQQIDEAKTKLASLEQKLLELQAKPTVAKVDADISVAEAKIEALKRKLKSLGAQISSTAEIPTEAKRFGGLVGMQQGGRVPGGYGGGDRIHILGEPGEWIHRKEAVRYYGASLMAALNKRAIPREILSSLLSKPTPPKPETAGVGRTVNQEIFMNLTLSQVAGSLGVRGRRLLQELAEELSLMAARGEVLRG